MKSRFLLSLLLVLPPALARADGVADFARAQIIFAQVMNGVAKYKEVAAATASATAAPAEPTAPEPLTDKSGKYFLPYNEQGELVGWAQKAIGAQVGAALGAKAGEKAGSLLAAKVPFGGLLAGGAKKKGKELGALAAVGGTDFIKSSSTLSFARLEDMCLYMHLHYSVNADYVKGLAAAMAVYPDIEKTYEHAVKQAYAAH